MGKLRLIIMATFQSVFRALYKVSFLTSLIHNITCFLAGLSRLFCGTKPLSIYAKGNNIPKKILILYEYEGCPFCRIVRETLSLLSIEVLIYPCPRETFKKYGHLQDSRFRGEVKKLGNKVMFPYLVDENTGKSFYESKYIATYLWENYSGGQKKPLLYRLSMMGPFLILGFFIHALMRPLPSMGILRTPSKRPEKLLELWGREHHVGTKRIREALCTLEIPYILHHSEVESKGTLKDPNTQKSFSSAKEACSYLFASYQDGSTTEESLLDYGKDDQRGKRASKK
tara:strand:+ start:3712 stop:4566 length:855 start_codon:yes stop_codon:yes gene_type:complete